MNQWEREEEQLERDLREGHITPADYNRKLREMQRDQQDEARGAAEDAAERAYNNTMDGFY